MSGHMHRTFDRNFYLTFVDLNSWHPFQLLDILFIASERSLPATDLLISPKYNRNLSYLFSWRASTMSQKED